MNDKPGARRQEAPHLRHADSGAAGTGRDWLICQGVTLVVMEATSAYWKPPFYLLEDDIECWVVIARDVKNVPRPASKRTSWTQSRLAKLAERGNAPGLVHPVPPAAPTAGPFFLTRYRRTSTQERTREKQRAEQLLEDAQIKLSRGDQRHLRQVRPGHARCPDRRAAHPACASRPGLQEHARQDQRLAGGAHRALHRSPRVHAGHDAGPDRRAHHPVSIPSPPGSARPSPRPFAAQVRPRLDQIPCIGITAAQDILAEIGTDMSRFPTPGHLVSWPSSRPGPASPASAIRPPPPARATPGSAAPSARPPPPPPAPRPSWPPAISGSRHAAASNAPWSPSATPCSPSSGTCSPTPPPTSPTSALTGTIASPRCAANASSSPNSNGYPARKSPSTTPPDTTSL